MAKKPTKEQCMAYANELLKKQTQVDALVAAAGNLSGCRGTRTTTASTARTASAGYTRLRPESGKRGIGSNG